MSMQTTRWSPDTCGCVVEYQWDSDQPAETRVHTIANVVKRCTDHNQIADKKSHFDVLMDENPRKNKLIGRLIEQHPGLTKPDANGNPQLKEDAISWSFDSARVLHVTIPSLNQNEKNAIQGWTHANLGNNKVKVH